MQQLARPPSDEANYYHRTDMVEVRLMIRRSALNSRSRTSIGLGTIVPGTRSQANPTDFAAASGMEVGLLELFLFAYNPTQGANTPTLRNAPLPVSKACRAMISLSASPRTRATDSPGWLALTSKALRLNCSRFRFPNPPNRLLGHQGY